MMNDWSTAEYHADRAWRHYEAGRWAQALREIDRALSVDPDHAEWWLGRGLTLDALSRFEEAVTAYEEAIARRSDDVEALLHLGVDLIRTGKAGKAIQAFERAQKIESANHASYCHRIAAHAQLGEHDDAETMFYLAQQLDENCPACFDHMAHSLAARGRLDRATWCWQRVAELDKHHPLVHANLGRAYWHLRKLERSRHSYERHLREHGNDAEARIEYATLLIEMDRLELAEDHLAQALVEHPTHPAAQHLAGDLALKNNQRDRAIEHYRTAMEAQPGRAGLNLGIALAMRAEEEDDAIREHLARELAVGGQDAYQVLQLGRMLICQRMHEETIALLSPMIDGVDDVFGDDKINLASALQVRSVAYAATEQHDAAIADCRRCVRLNPQHKGAWRQLFDQYLARNQFDRAQVCLNHATELSPDDEHLKKLAHQLKWQRLSTLARKVSRRRAA